MASKKSTSMSLTHDTLDKIEDIQQFEGFDNRSETVEELVDEVHRLGYDDAIGSADDTEVRRDGGEVAEDTPAEIDDDGWGQPIDKFDALLTVGGVSALLGIQQWTLGNHEAMAVWGLAASTMLGIASYQKFIDNGE